jgi:hypothetical protein
MLVRAIFGLAATIIVSVVLYACGGLDGVRGILLSIEGNEYVVQNSRGYELRFVVNELTRKDDVLPGDDVRVYTTKDGYAAYIQRLNGEQGGAGSAVHEVQHNRGD